MNISTEYHFTAQNMPKQNEHLKKKPKESTNPYPPSIFARVVENTGPVKLKERRAARMTQLRSTDNTAFNSALISEEPRIKSTNKTNKRVEREEELPLPQKNQNPDRMEVEDESKPEVIEQPSKPKRLAKDFRMSCISGDIEAVKVYLVEHPDELVFNGDGHIYEGFKQAIVNNNLELVEFLLTIPEISANAHHRDNWPLRLAFWNNHLRVADRLLLVEGIQESITCEIIKYDLNDAAKKGHIGLFQRLLELHVSKEALLLEGYDPSGKSKLDVLRHYANQFPKLKAELDALTDEKVLRSLAQPYFLDDDEEMTNLLNGMDLLDHEELLIALEQKLKIDT